MHLNWKENLGNLDRVIRLLVGLVFLSLPFFGAATGIWAAAATLFGVFLFIEAFLGY